MENKIYKLVIGCSLLLTGVATLIGYLVFKDISVVVGLLAGAFARLIGFIVIIAQSRRMITSASPALNAVSGYLVRFVFYGVVIYLSIKYNANVIALLVGFTLVNIAIYIMDIVGRKDGE